MDAGYACADGGENLVRDCVCPGGHLIRRNLRVVLTAEENNLISLLNSSYIGNINHSQIHAHSSDDWSALTAHENLTAIGKQALITVGVADRQGRDDAFTLGDEGLAIADAGLRRYFF